MTLSKREKVLLTGLVLIGLYFGYYMYLVQPMLTKQASLLTQRQELQGRVDFLEGWETKRPQLEKEIADLDAERANLESMALTEALVIIENTARDTGVKIRDISLKDVYTPTGGAFAANFSGSYRSIRSFVAILEATATTFDVGSLRISGQGAELQATITATMLSGRIPPAQTLPGTPYSSPFGVR